MRLTQFIIVDKNYLLTAYTMCTLISQLFLFLRRQERKKYHLHREKARAQPDKYITVIIDGMDQSKTNIPTMTREAKSTQNLYRLRTHLTGALIHTQSPHGKHIQAFYDFMQWAHDSNLIIEVLSQVLHSIREKLPPNLYLQLDNCSRENKNKYFLGFCSLLVEKKVFQKVTIHVHIIAITIILIRVGEAQLFTSWPHTRRCRSILF